MKSVESWQKQRRGAPGLPFAWPASQLECKQCTERTWDGALRRARGAFTPHALGQPPAGGARGPGAWRPGAGAAPPTLSWKEKSEKLTAAPGRPRGDPSERQGAGGYGSPARGREESHGAKRAA